MRHSGGWENRGATRTPAPSGRAANSARFHCFAAGPQVPSRDRVAALVESDQDIRDAELPAEPAERVRVIVEHVIAALGVDGDVEVEESERQITATVEAEDVGRLIGRRGQTIDAVQLV